MGGKPGPGSKGDQHPEVIERTRTPGVFNPYGNTRIPEGVHPPQRKSTSQWYTWGKILKKTRSPNFQYRIILSERSQILTQKVTVSVKRPTGQAPNIINTKEVYITSG